MGKNECQAYLKAIRTRYRRARKRSRCMRTIIKYGLQPALLVGSMMVWFAFNKSKSILLLTIIVVQLILYLCEKFYPAHGEWKQKPSEKLTLMGPT